MHTEHLVPELEVALRGGARDLVAEQCGLVARLSRAAARDHKRARPVAERVVRRRPHVRVHRLVALAFPQLPRVRTSGRRRNRAPSRICSSNARGESEENTRKETETALRFHRKGILTNALKFLMSPRMALMLYVGKSS